MATILFDSPVFGPVRSRRLGVSLGINLLPADGKVCSFDCIYCECGLNTTHRPHERMPTREAVREALRAKLLALHAEGVTPDNLTFAGNGEPTSHPHFAEIVADTRMLRDELCPEAHISVLTNAMHIDKLVVFEALLSVETPLLKLDTVDIDYIRRVDRPQKPIDLAAQLERMKAFHGHAVIQTMFLEGIWEGESVGNTSERYVEPWLEALHTIGPKFVTIYTIDRETPAKGLKKAAPETLDAIAERVRALGLPCQVSY